MTRRIVVDDADDSIHYASSGWYIANPQALNALGNFGPVYKNTSHGTTTNGSTLSFRFSGTTVEVMGTIAVQKLADGSYDPTWVCTVDGSPIPNPNPTFAYPENNWSLCSASSLSPSSPHTLEIIVHTRGTAFYVDNIFYTPTADPTALGGAVLEVLNTDASVSFGTGWEGWGAQNVTRMAGSEVTLSFRGTAVSLVGYVPEELPHNATTARYSIDGGAPTTIQLAGLPAGSTTTIGSSSQGHGHSLSSDSIEGRQGMAPSQQWAREQLGEDGAGMGYGFRYPGHTDPENNPANPFSNPTAAPSSEALAPLSPNRRRNLSPTNRGGSEEGSSGDATATELAYARSSVARSDLGGQRGDGGGRTVVDVPPSYSRE
uniref:Uncharacterized protein n=1 Tax=Mycena chlorophos TaxID=658473 RepID=A0ABQ0LX82_MYCCL|nr:predicted protein [Mycena chlorophos]